MAEEGPFSAVVEYPQEVIEATVTLGGAGLPGPAGPSGGPGPAGVGVPVGGTAGQLLTKLDSTDYNTGWATSTSQPLDADLTAIAALTGTNTIYYRSGANTWSPVTIGSGLSFSSGSLAAVGGAATWGAIDGTLSDQTDLQAALDAKQPLDSDLTSIAALTTTSFGRGFLTQADAAAARSYIGAGTSSFDGAFSSLTGTPTTLSGYGITDAQPLDSDLTSIAALSTTSFGRGFLTQADAAAARTYIGAGTSSFDGAFSSLTGVPTTLSGYGITDAQPLDSDLTAIAALTTDSFGRGLLPLTTAAAVRSYIGAGTGTGSGTVTNTGGSLTANSVVLGAGTDDTKVVAGIITDGTSKLTLGVAGTSVGSVDFKNATSGTITLSPVTGALGTVTITLPASSTTMVGTTTSQTLTNKFLEPSANSTGGPAPIKFTSGALLTTPVAGSLEYASGNFYITDTTPTQKQIATISGTETFTNKTLTSPTLTGATLNGTTILNGAQISSASLLRWNMVGPGTTDIYAHASTSGWTFYWPLTGTNGDIVIDTGTQTLTNKTLTSGTNTFPTFNQNTTGSAASLSISGQTGLLTFTGLASTNRAKTVRDAADTILELGGSYTPSGTWTNMTLVTPALGTPSALVLTNATGTPSAINLTNGTALPVSGITASTSTALGVGSIELGHATANTLTGSGGVLSVEGVAVPTISSTNTLSNKRTLPRTHSTSSATSWTPDFDTYDVEIQTALAGAVTINAPTYSSANEAERRILRIKDDGTARAITWTTGSSGAFRASSDLALPTTTTLSKTLYMGFMYNSTDSRWDLMAKLDNF